MNLEHPPDDDEIPDDLVEEVLLEMAEELDIPPRVSDMPDEDVSAWWTRLLDREGELHVSDYWVSDAFDRLKNIVEDTHALRAEKIGLMGRAKTSA